MKIASKILSTLILIVLIIALVLFTIPRLFGIKMYNVRSGSMRPEYEIGDIVYVFPIKDKDGKNIKERDVITYMLSQDTIVTHRVIRIERDNETQGLEDRERYLYYTKGDYNNAEDGTPQYFRNVLGVVKFKIPKVGVLLQFIQEPRGMIITITVLLAIILLTVIFNLSNKGSKGGSEKTGSFGKGRNEKVLQTEGFNKNFGKKAIRERRMPEALANGDSVESAPIEAGAKRVPPKGWGSGKSR